jgi:hypothetical protein
MVLGPAPEFCVQARKRVDFPDAFSVSVLELRPIWPDNATD